MRHRKSGRKLGRTSSHRKALLRSLAISLFKHEKIETTLAKAKEARPFVERLITMARKGTLAHRRRALGVLGISNRLGNTEPKKIVRKLFDDIGKRYADRPGGYTRILKLSKWRLGDGTQQAVLELVVAEAGGGGHAKPAVRPRTEAPSAPPEPVSPRADAPAPEPGTPEPGTPEPGTPEPADQASPPQTPSGGSEPSEPAS